MSFPKPSEKILKCYALARSVSKAAKAHEKK